MGVHPLTILAHCYLLVDDTLTLVRNNSLRVFVQR
jgi:hypothetical protein